MKLAFLGTPEVAAGTLRALVEAGHDVVAVVTRADTRRSRGPASSPSPVKAAAVELGLPVVYKPADILASRPELGVVVAYGRLIKPDVLAEVPMVNVHFSLLPRWRGAAPVERAILAGDPETGVCLMQLEEGLDTGPVYARETTPIGEEETADELRARLGRIGTDLLLRSLAEGLPVPVPQEGEPTYAAKVEPAELQLDLTRPAELVNRSVRVGRAWTTFRGKRLLVRRARVLADGQGLTAGQIQGNKVGTGDGTLELQLVQPEGKPVMDGAAWARGARPAPDERLGQ
ncbi:MAG TPA: methionyl-tRNA formyltransferase [Acidimicrobiales bacterium]|nr:methionyl-tRNA formyltransferase [Acidimicrobiales bacterium]